jgi:hypothetical protein
MLDPGAFRAFVESYNRAVFPAQLFFYLLGIGAAVLVFVRPGKWADVAVKAVLGAFWAWLGAVYFFIHYSQINSAGYTLGVIALGQAVYFLVDVFHRRTTFYAYTHPNLGHAGAAVAGLAFIGYPAAALLLGHGWPALQLFGMAQVGIYTCGMLLFTFDRKPKWRFTFIPVLLAFIGGLGPAAQLRYYEDYAYSAAGVVLLGAWMWASSKYKEKKKK